LRETHRSAEADKLLSLSIHKARAAKDFKKRCGAVGKAPKALKGWGMGPKLNLVKSECQRSHLVARISLNYLPRLCRLFE